MLNRKVANFINLCMMESGRILSMWNGNLLMEALLMVSFGKRFLPGLKMKENN